MTVKISDDSFFLGLVASSILINVRVGLFVTIIAVEGNVFLTLTLPRTSMT